MCAYLCVCVCSRMCVRECVSSHDICMTWMCACIIYIYNMCMCVRESMCVLTFLYMTWMCVYLHVCVRLRERVFVCWGWVGGWRGRTAKITDYQTVNCKVR